MTEKRQEIMPVQEGGSRESQIVRGVIRVREALLSRKAEESLSSEEKHLLNLTCAREFPTIAEIEYFRLQGIEE
jgi:hypothetical protein